MCFIMLYLLLLNLKLIQCDIQNEIVTMNTDSISSSTQSMLLTKLVQTIDFIATSSNINVDDEIDVQSKNNSTKKCETDNVCTQHEICVVGWCICKKCPHVFECNCNTNQAEIVATTNTLPTATIESTNAQSTQHESINKIQHPHMDSSRYITRISFKRTYDHQGYQSNYLFKTYDLADTYTFGFGFGLPVILILIIIASLLYSLRKKYTTSNGTTSTETSFIVNSTNNHTSPSRVLTYSTDIDNNSNSSLMFTLASPMYLTHAQLFNNHQSTIRRYQDSHHTIDSNGNLIYHLNSPSDTDSTLSSSYYDESLMHINYCQTNNTTDMLSIKPPIYEDISNFSESDKLPTYDSFRRKSKSNVFV